MYAPTDAGGWVEDEPARKALQRLRLVELTAQTFAIGSRVLAFGARLGTVSDLEVRDGVNWYRVDLDGAADFPRTAWGECGSVPGTWLPATALVEE